MAKLGKISSIKKNIQGTDSKTLNGSLAANGINRFPGTGMILTPCKEANGDYRTGLDPNALYIRKMEIKNPAEAKQEKERVESLYKELTALSGMTLDPRSEYYTKMMDDQYGTSSRASIVKLVDGENVFNLNSVQDSITFAWLRVHPQIATSYQQIESGQVYRSGIQFFVDDEEYESEIIYKQNTLINKAVNTLDTLSIDKQIRVATLLGLPVNFSTKPQIIYNELSKYVRDTTSKDGNKTRNIDLFNKFALMADDKLKVRYLVKEGILFNIYREKAGRLFEGENEVAKDIEELIDRLSTKKYQEDLMALEEKIKASKLIERELKY